MENVFIDPMLKDIKDHNEALNLQDFLAEISESIGFQMMNMTFEKDDKSQIEELNEKTSIVKFNPSIIEKDYKNWFKESEKNNLIIPKPAVDFERIIYTDYGKFDDDKEKVELDKNEVGDIFKRDGTNYVKDDILMNILRKMKKN